MNIRRRAIVILLTACLLPAWGAALSSADDSSDSVDAWRKWKSIDAAVASRPLDGPEDIKEKAEIIADRLDELERESAKQKNESEQDTQILQSLRNQKEIMQELSGFQQGRDVQAPQRMHDLTERIQKLEQLQKRRKESMADLQKEIDRMKTMLEDYKKKANALRRMEGGKP